MKTFVSQDYKGKVTYFFIKIEDGHLHIGCYGSLKGDITEEGFDNNSKINEIIALDDKRNFVKKELSLKTIPYKMPYGDFVQATTKHYGIYEIKAHLLKNPQYIIFYPQKGEFYRIKKTEVVNKLKNHKIVTVNAITVTISNLPKYFKVRTKYSAKLKEMGFKFNLVDLYWWQEYDKWSHFVNELPVKLNSDKELYVIAQEIKKTINANTISVGNEKKRLVHIEHRTEAQVIVKEND